MLSLGETLRHARLDADMSVNDLAEALDVSASYIRMVERDERVPSQATLTPWAQGLDLRIETYTVVEINGVPIRVEKPLSQRGTPTSGDRRDSLRAHEALEEILQVLIERLPQPQKEQ